MSSRSGSAIDFFSLLSSLKRTPRTGWVQHRVRRPESIADHMYRMSVMALVAGKAEGIDVSKCIQMALAHDMAEAIVGDIAPSDGVSKEEKYRREASAMEEIGLMLSQTGVEDASEQITGLWHEYEEGKSAEALLLKDLDKLEMILQAHEYEEEEERFDLGSFFESTHGKFRTDTGKKWALEIEKRREARHRRAPSRDRQ